MADIRRGWLTAEDEALKAKLSGIRLSSPKNVNGVKVRVWFGMPTSERESLYPFITIDLVSVDFAFDRAHSAEITAIDYWPSEYATFAEYAAAHNLTFDNDEQYAMATRWHPYDLSFQVATHTLYQQHDRELLQILLSTNFLPLSRWGYLPVPADDSVRWLDNEGYATADYNAGDAEHQLRVFRKVHNVKVSSHLPPEDPFIYYKVLQVAGVINIVDGPAAVDAWTNS